MANKKTGTEPEIEETDESQPLTRDEITALVNSAITTHLKRSNASIAKTIQETVASAIGSLQPPKAEDGSDPVSSLKSELEKLKSENQEAKTRARQIEERARKTEVRSQLASQLEPLGIKGVRASAVIAHMESSGALKFDENLNPSLVIKRSRIRGAQAEEQSFDDLKAGISDWAKSEEAAEFLPAPQVAPQRPGVARQTATQAQPRVAPTNGPFNEDDALRQTEQMLGGASLNQLLRK